MDDLDKMKKDLDTLQGMPESELKFLSEDPKKMAMDLRMYRLSKERDGGAHWEKLKKIRQMFKK